MPTRKRGGSPETDFLELVNKENDLRIPKERFPKIKKSVEMNRKFFTDMEKAKLRKEHEPSTFLSRLIEMGQEPE